MKRKEKKGSSVESEGTREAPMAIVGIGASAGGLEAIESFFKAMPVDSGMAFVVVQHLSPDYKSLMVELLSRKTAIPVHRAESGMRVAPNNIYLIPPKKNLTIFHGQLLLEDQCQRETPNLPVDIFLRSLAEDQGERAVAVILSGTGSDGARGVRAVKEAGGLVLVQDETTAKFDGMPRAAAASGLADFILPPEDMPSQLLACLRHPYTARQERQQGTLKDETGMTRLFSLLRNRTKVDFTYYKPSTIIRRVERRIAVTQSDDLDAYVRYAEQNPAELMALYRELLIGVTSFFRDPEVMDVLREKVLPELITKYDHHELRFWVPGCSTGEEAYTLAILCRETMEDLGVSRHIKIFATDIDRDAIAKAGVGAYPESIAADLNPGLLAKYFHRRGDQYQVARNLREMVVFAQHNLVKDPPFTRVDLVSCRNLLIYLQTNLQHRAMEMFAFSLRSGGVLVLGTSETVGDLEEFFEPIDRKARIYRFKGKMPMRQAGNAFEPSTANDRTLPLAVSNLGALSRVGSREQERLISRLLELFAGMYASLAVVVNEHLEVLYTLGNPVGILNVPAGRAVYDISKMVNRELSIPIATGVQKVLRSGEELIYSNVRLREGDETRVIRVRIEPLPGRKNDEILAVVFFENVGESPAEDRPAPSVYDLDAETSQRIQDLEQELQFTRENLQATIEELETSNEELQATNEELLASNEELQSTNEELQSANEELYTVNTEYQNKIIELTEARNDVENLLYSSGIGILILDEDMCIRRYSPQAATVFNLVDSDVGRPLQHLSHRLQDLDVLEMARRAQRDNEPQEHEAREKDGRCFLVRTFPYRIGPQTNSGVVITLVDITARKEIDRALRESEQRFRDLANNGRVLIWTCGPDKKCDYFNAIWLGFTGRTLEQELGDGWVDGVHPEDMARCLQTFHAAFDKREPFSVAYRLRRHDGQYRWIEDDGVPRYDDKGNFLGYIGHCFDITDRVEAEIALRKRESHIRELYCLLSDAEKVADMGSWTWDVASDTVKWSDNLFRLFGLDPAHGAPSYAEHGRLYTPESFDRLHQAVQEAVDRGTPYEIELDAVRADGTVMRCVARGQVERDETGAVCRLYGSFQKVQV